MNDQTECSQAKGTCPGATLLAPDSQPMTARLLAEACDRFCEQVVRHPPLLRDLYSTEMTLAREISATLSSHQVICLLQEHPTWVQQEAPLPTSRTLAALVADHLTTLVCHTLNTQWAGLLLSQPEQAGMNGATPTCEHE